jgi:replication-associated recombination protein RarA
MKNSFERLITEFNIKDSGTVSFVYGALKEEFYLLQGKNLGITKSKLSSFQFLFWNYAVQNGFDVVFVTKGERGHCLDKQSADQIQKALLNSSDIPIHNIYPINKGFANLNNREVAKNLVEDINSDGFLLKDNRDNYFLNMLAKSKSNLDQLTKDLLRKLLYNDSFHNTIFYLADFDLLIKDSEDTIMFSHALSEFSKRSDKNIKFFLELNRNRIDSQMYNFYPQVPMLEYFLQLDSNFTTGHAQLDSTMFIATPGKEELTAYVEHFYDTNNLPEWDPVVRQKIVRFMLSMNQHLNKWNDLFIELLERRDESGDCGGCSLKALKAIMKDWSKKSGDRFGSISNDDRDAMTRLEKDYAENDVVISAIKNMVSTYEDGIKKPSSIEGFRRHMAFLGNPGTGKTSVARLVGEIFQEKGLLSRGHFIEARADDFIVGHVGGTAIKTAEKCKEALGGVLFIDEAYGIAQNSFGKEAVATLLQFMENHRNDLCVIMAGYTTEMNNFMRINPGLNSRIPEDNRLIFRDFTPIQLANIFKSNIIKRVDGEQHVDENIFDFVKFLFENFKKEYSESAKDPRMWGNARVAEELVQQILIAANQRCKKENKSSVNVLLRDFELKYKRQVDEFKKRKLNDDMPELSSAMDEIRALGSPLITETMERYIGFLKSFGKSMRDYRPHLVFTGNPGTGKTTLARKLGRLLKEELKEEELFQGGNFVECKREDLLREGAENAGEKFKEAIGGVLFIDEAYALTENDDPAGRVVVNQLLTFMENYRDQTVVVLAGYRNEMRHFMDSNPGLRRRVKDVIEIPDFTSDKLLSIFRSKIKELDRVKISKSLDEKLPAIFEYMYQFRDENFGNAGTVEKFKNQMIESPRLINLLKIQNTKSVELEVEDLPKEYLLRFTENESNEATNILEEMRKIPGSAELVQFCEELESEVAFNKILLNQLGKLNTVPLRVATSIKGSTAMDELLELLAAFLMELNLIKKVPVDQAIISANPASLTAPYVGNTIPQVNEFFSNCHGKLVVINNAHDFYGREGNSFLVEALAATKENLQKFSERLVCVIIDSKEEMDMLLRMDMSLASIFNRRISISKADDSGVIQMIKSKLRKDGKSFEDSPQVDEMLNKGLEQFKNNEGVDLGAFATGAVQRILSRQRKRLIEKNKETRKINNKELQALINDDFELC